MPAKKGKSKGVAVHLDEFLVDSGGSGLNAVSLAPPAAETNWADAPFDLRSGSERPFWERRQHSPSGTQRGLNEEPDLSRVPDEPPFKAFVTNVSYSATREDLKDYFGEKNDIKSIYMIQNDGAFKGSANIEFYDKDSLISALGLHGSTMLGRTIRVEVSTSQGRSNRDGAGSDRMSRQRSDYNPVGEIADDSWSRGEDYRNVSTRRQFDNEPPNDRYVPPSKRSGDNFSRNSRDDRPPESFRRDYDDRRSNFDGARERDFDDDRGSRRQFSDNRSYEEILRGDGRRQNSGDNRFDSRNNRENNDAHSFDRDRRDTSDAFPVRGSNFEDVDRNLRREDQPRYQPRDREANYRSESPRGKSDYSSHRSSEFSQDLPPRERERDSKDYYNSQSDIQPQPVSSQLSSRSNPDSFGRNSNDGNLQTPPYNSNNEYQFPARNRTNSQRSGDSHGDGQRYTLESSFEKARNPNDSNGAGGPYGSRNRYGEPDREHERRYERYQNDIAPRSDRQFENRRRTESGSGSGVGGYDSRRNEGRGGGGGGGGFRDGRGSAGGGGYGSGYQRSERSYNDYNRGGSSRDDRYDRRGDSRRGGPYSPNKNYNDDQYNDREDDIRPRPKLELAPRSTTEPVVPREAESRPFSIFGAAKPVDTQHRELEVAARKSASSSLKIDTSSKGLGEGRRMGGGGGGGAYRAPHHNNSHAANHRNNAPESAAFETSPDSVINKFAVLNAETDDDYHS